MVRTIEECKDNSAIKHIAETIGIKNVRDFVNVGAHEFTFRLLYHMSIKILSYRNYLNQESWD